MPRLRLRKPTDAEEQALADFVSPASLTLMVDFASIPRLAISLHPTTRRHGALTVQARVACDPNEPGIKEVIAAAFPIIRNALWQARVRFIAIRDVDQSYVPLACSLGFKKGKAGEYVAKI